MRMSVAGRWLVVSCLAWLAACGGGSGGSAGSHGGDGSSTLPTERISLSPSNLSMTVTQYTSGAFVITGILSPDPFPGGTIYVSVNDDKTTFYAGPSVSGAGVQFSVTMQSGPWLEPGAYTGTLTVTACQDPGCDVTYAHYSAAVPYSVTVQAPPGEIHRLLPSALAVAFADTSNGAILTRTLSIHDNFAAATSWTATSDADWLTVTSAGTADVSNLVISANPALLPTGQTSVAEIQVTGPDVVGTTIHVGLWRDADGAPQLRVIPAVRPVDLVRDPYRPLVYASVGTDQILVYNAHTATLERTIAGVGTHLQTLAVSPDGERLYATDGDVVQLVDLQTDSRIASWPLPAATGARHSMLVVQPNGDDVLLLDSGEALARGSVVMAQPGIIGKKSATDDGKTVYSLNPAPFEQLEAWVLSYSNGTNEFHVLEAAHSNNDLDEYLSSGEQVAVSGDGSRLYVADHQGECMGLDPVSLEVVTQYQARGSVIATGIATGAAGNIACAYQSRGDFSDPDIGVFSPGGSLVSTYPSTGTVYFAAQVPLVASADGLVSVDVVPSTGDIRFAPMGAPASNGSEHSYGTRTGIEVERRLAAGAATRR